MEADQRFRCVREPSGSWMVWDKVTDRTATLGGCILRGREKSRASAACTLLETIYRNRLDAQSVRNGAILDAKPGVA